MAYSLHLLRHLRETIGRNIHHYRFKHKMPLPKLARLAGVPQDRLDHFEMGKGAIGTEELLRIACALRVNVGQLVGCYPANPGTGN